MEEEPGRTREKALGIPDKIGYNFCFEDRIKLDISL